MMGECMEFPDTFDEFVRDYAFKDSEKIYTNGSELIPVFRVKQWLEHISITKNDLGVDWTNYKDADGNSLDYLILNVLQNSFDCGDAYGYTVADKIIDLLPSVTPQEPRAGHWIGHPHEWGDNWQYSDYECSICHNWAHFDTDFCPNCGAKMAESEGT